MNNEMVLNSTQSAFDEGVQRLIQENKTLTAENAALKRVAEVAVSICTTPNTEENNYAESADLFYALRAAGYLGESE